MARARVTLDTAAIAKMLLGQDPSIDIDSALDAAATAIAEGVSIPTHPDAEVTVRSFVSGRKGPRTTRAVSIAEAYGLNVEAVHGPLRRSAAAQGLEVKSREPT